MKNCSTNEAEQQSPHSLVFSGADLIWLLGSICSLHRLPFDPVIVQRQFPPPCSTTTIHEALTLLGFKVGTLYLQPGTDFSRLPLPSVAFLQSDRNNQAECQDTETDEAQRTEPFPYKPILVMKSDGEQLLFFRAGSRTPKTVPVEQVPSLILPHVIVITREAQSRPETAEEPFSGNEPKRFGFRWFVPELLKHKNIWRDILLASLVIQLIGLATPLFTQVVIDKVVVHQTRNTLVVIDLGMLVFFSVQRRHAHRCPRPPVSGLHIEARPPVSGLHIDR